MNRHWHKPAPISGLIFEDRIRTTRMFLMGTVAPRPTHPIDISAKADVIQQIPTHVKLKKKTKLDEEGNVRPFAFSIDKNGNITCDGYKIDMACAFQFWRLFGDHRLVIGFYVEKTHYDVDGKKQTKIVVEEILEIIFTEETFRKFRGKVPLSEIEWIKASLLAWKPSPQSEEAAAKEQEWANSYFHGMVDKMVKEDRVGLARPGIHIDKVRCGVSMSNKRIQSTISTKATVEQVMQEDIGYGPGKYRNANYPQSKIQDRVILYSKGQDFHGLSLPWETLASKTSPAKGWSKLKRINAPKKEKPSVALPSGEYEGCARELVATTNVDIAEGVLIVRKFTDGWRIVEIQSKDDETKANFTWACKTFGAEKIGKTQSWLATLWQAKKIRDALKRRPLPDDPGHSLLSPIKRQKNLNRIHTGNGHYLTKELPSGDHVIWQGAFKDQPKLKQILERRMSAAFRVYGLSGETRGLLSSKEYDGDINWIVPKNDPDLIEKAARALVDYTFLEHRPLTL